MRPNTTAVSLHRKPLAAEEPVADEGAFAGVPAQVCLEMGRLAVDLATAGHVTAVLDRFAQILASRAESVDLLTVGAGARRPPGGVAALAACRGRPRRRRRLLGSRGPALPLTRGEPAGRHRAVVRRRRRVRVGLVRHEPSERRVGGVLRQLDERRDAGLVERAEHRVVDGGAGRRHGAESAGDRRREGAGRGGQVGDPAAGGGARRAVDVPEAGAGARLRPAVDRRRLVGGRGGRRRGRELAGGACGRGAGDRVAGSGGGVEVERPGVVQVPGGGCEPRVDRGRVGRRVESDRPGRARTRLGHVGRPRVAAGRLASRVVGRRRPRRRRRLEGLSVTV